LSGAENIEISAGAAAEKYEPSPEVIQRAYVKDYEEFYRASISDPDRFWERMAEELEWFKRWDYILDWQYPWAEWFKGGRCNIVHNALDTHVKTWRRNKVALIWESETGETRTISYGEMARLVNRFANVLKSLGVKKGDRVAIYLPRIPEQVVAMLATAKIGAVHTVIYYGYGPAALRERIEDTASKVVISADGSRYGGRIVTVPGALREAAESTTVENIVIVRHVGIPLVTEQYEPRWAARGARYNYLDDLLHDVSDRCDTEVMDSNDDLSITHTSGSAGVPRGIIHRHGGYMVGTYATSKLVFNLRDEDVYWCTADLGWITGQSYVVYGALLNGATVFMYEGAYDYPAPDRWWALIEKHAINILYTTPTTLRRLRRYGDEYPAKHNLESLRLLGTVGEAIDHETWKWYYKVIGRGRCPIVDTWWQTETGMIIVSPMESMPLKPGSIGKPFPTIEASVIDMSGNELPPYTAGLLALKRPWPALMKNVLNDPQTYKDFWETVENWYVSGDLAYKDEEGYFWVRGRADDLIKSGGLRIGNVELEGALLEHPAVAEAASIGSVDPEQGEVVKAFVVLRSRWESSPELETELKDRVRKKIGPFAVPIDIKFVRALPRTMSGKILRRVLREGESK